MVLHLDILFDVIPLHTELIWIIVRMVGDHMEYHTTIKSLYAYAQRLDGMIHTILHPEPFGTPREIQYGAARVDRNEDRISIDIHMDDVPKPHNIVVMNYVYHRMKARYGRVHHAGIYTTNMLVVYRHETW